MFFVAAVMSNAKKHFAKKITYYVIESTIVYRMLEAGARINLLCFSRQKPVFAGARIPQGKGPFWVLFPIEMYWTVSSKRALQGQRVTAKERLHNGLIHRG